MRPIARQQVSELSDREQYRLNINEYLGIQYAAQQRRKRVAEARMEMELDLEREDNYDDSRT